MRSCSPRGQPVFKFVGRVIPHFRVGGTEAGRGAGEPGGADVGAYARRPAKRHAFAGSCGGFVGEADLSDEGHSPVFYGILLDAEGLRPFLYFGVSDPEAPEAPKVQGSDLQLSVLIRRLEPLARRW